MKKIFLYLLILISYSAAGQQAKIRIDVDRPIGRVDPKVFGVFMEPIHFSGGRLGLPDSVSFNTLYGNLYDPDSPLANSDGFRSDYIDAMRELKITNMRWPGGNFVAGYHWEDGIGPKENRPVRKDLAWGGIETNHVGTDEWVQLNRAMGSENVVCVNLGLGTIDEARYWVEYCNLDGTYYSDLRAQYGNPEPYGIKYWCLGNEVDGSPWIMGYKNAEDYCKIAIEAGKAMRQTDPEIQLISNGSSYYEGTGIWIDWNWKVITELRDIADYLSIHKYWERTDDYYEYVGQSAMEVEEKISTVSAQIDVAKTLYPDLRLQGISVDEWAPFGQTMQTTLAVAMYLNSFIRHADKVKMANYTLMTSLLGNDREKGTFRTPLFYTFKSYSLNCRGISVDTYVECDTFNTKIYQGIPYLDVTSVYDEKTATLVINVVNRHKINQISAEIHSTTGTLDTTAEITVITDNTLNESFEYDKEQSYRPEEISTRVKNNKLAYTFEPHSFTQIRISLKE